MVAVKREKLKKGENHPIIPIWARKGTTARCQRGETDMWLSKKAYGLISVGKGR